MGFKSMVYSDKESAELEKLKGTELLTININGSLVCSMFQEQYQRDPSVEELDGIVSRIADSDICDVMMQHAEDYIRGMMTDMFDDDTDEGDEDDDN